MLEFAPAVELVLNEHGQCAGAVLYNMETEEYFLVRAKAVVMVTGGCGRLHIQGFMSTNHYGATADGIVMAYRAGVPVSFLHTVQYHPTGVVFPEQAEGILITEKFRGASANLVNVPGLFVAGEVGGGIHGANRLMGSPLLDIVVFGPEPGQVGDAPRRGDLDCGNPGGDGNGPRLSQSSNSHEVRSRTRWDRSTSHSVPASKGRATRDRALQCEQEPAARRSSRCCSACRQDSTARATPVARHRSGEREEVWNEQRSGWSRGRHTHRTAAAGPCGG